MRHPFRHITVLCAATVILSGCGSAISYVPTIGDMWKKNYEYQRADWSPLKQVNYAAADDLYQKAGARLLGGKPLQLVALTNIGKTINPENPDPPIEWLIPQQVGNRLGQLGIPVTQPENIAPPQGQSPHQIRGSQPLQLVPTGAVRKPSGRDAGNIYLEGDYAYLRNDLLISLRLIDGTSKQIIAVSEYNLDVTSDIYVLLDPDTAGGGLFGSGWMR